MSSPTEVDSNMLPAQGHEKDEDNPETKKSHERRLSGSVPIMNEDKLQNMLPYNIEPHSGVEQQQVQPVGSVEVMGEAGEGLVKGGAEGAESISGGTGGSHVSAAGTTDGQNIAGGEATAAEGGTEGASAGIPAEPTTAVAAEGVADTAGGSSGVGAAGAHTAGAEGTKKQSIGQKVRDKIGAVFKKKGAE